ncbi:MAG: amidohydrolase family protein [Spongiibacteraceae bacterium]
MQPDYKIVDADAHVNPPPTFWSEYLPAHLRELAPRIEHDEECDWVVFEGKRKKVNLIGAQAGREGKDFKMHGRLSDARSGGWMPGERLKDMDTDHIHAAVLFGGGPLGSSNPELYRASFDAYNRWVADFCSHDPKRLLGVGYVPMQGVDESIAMVRDMHKRGIKAVNIPAFPQSFTPVVSGGQMLALTGDPNGPRQYSDAEFDPFWQTVIELGMPVTIHLGARGARFEQKDKFLPDLLMTKLTMAEPIAILIYAGVFQRFPDLKFVSVESGVGWFAFAANYMDNTWKKQRHWVNSPLTEMPSFYMDRNVYGSFINDPVGVSLRHWPGAKNIMWSSDYPHSETTFPHSLEVIAHNFEGVPEEEKQWMISGCAGKLFGL